MVFSVIFQLYLQTKVWMGDSVQLNDVKGDYQNVNKEVEYDTLNSNLVELNDYAILNTKTKPSSDRHKDESKPNLADSPVLWRRRNIYGWVLVIILISTATLIVCIYIFVSVLFLYIYTFLRPRIYAGSFNEGLSVIEQ